MRGGVPGRVSRLGGCCMLRGWRGGGRGGAETWSPRGCRFSACPVRRPRARRRWLGWLVVGVLGLLFGGLALASIHAPVVSAAGNPLYLLGTGSAPSCAASTLDQNAGNTNPGCQIQSAAGGGVATTWTFGNLPAQTVAAGVWTFTMYWTGGAGRTRPTQARGARLPLPARRARLRCPHSAPARAEATPLCATRAR